MNLHSIVSSVIGAVNPQQPVGVQESVGISGTNPDGTPVPAYATPGSITASIGGQFTAEILDPNNADVLTVTAVLSGSLQIGDEIAGSDGTNALPTGTNIITQLSGAPGGTGTYQISQSTLAGLLNPCPVTAASTWLNVTGQTGGVLLPGQTLADTSGLLTDGTIITGAGPGGGLGLYPLSDQQTVPSETMTTSMSIIAQLQPLSASELRHMDMLNLQGTHKAFYFSVWIRGIVRVTLKGGDLLTLIDGSVYLVNQPLEDWVLTSGWTHVVGTLQDGS